MSDSARLQAFIAEVRDAWWTAAEYNDAGNVIYTDNIEAAMDAIWAAIATATDEAPEPGWEYGIRPLDDDVVLGVQPMPTLETARIRSNNIRGGWGIVRRTKAGAWERVEDDA